MFMYYTTYLFDFDGTLADSMPCFSQKMIQLLEKHHIDYPKDIIKTVTPLGTVDIARYFQEKLHVPCTIEEIIKEMDDYALIEYRDHIPLKEGVWDYLHTLKKQHCSLNILTASPHHLLDPCLKRNGVWDLFDHVMSCDDFEMTKSDPAIYAAVADRIGVTTKDMVFFDDNVYAIQTAVSANLYTIGVYDRSSEEYTAQIQKICKQYIHSMKELSGLIAK